MNKKIVFLIVAAATWHAISLCGEMTGNIKLLKDGEIIYPSLLQQAPSGIPHINRTEPLVAVQVAFQNSSTIESHFLPIQLFLQGDTAKKAGEQLVLKRLSGMKNVADGTVKLVLDDSFNRIDLKQKYDQFRASTSEPLCLGCIACLMKWLCQ